MKEKTKVKSMESVARDVTLRLILERLDMIEKSLTEMLRKPPCVIPVAPYRPPEAYPTPYYYNNTPVVTCLPSQVPSRSCF